MFAALLPIGPVPTASSARGPCLTLGLCAVLLACVCACDDDSESVRRMASASKPHVHDFLRYERWVQRVHGGDFSPSQERALKETVFAPIRHDYDVLAAQVVHQQERERRYVFPEQAEFPLDLEGVALRQPDGPALRVATWERCPLGLPTWWRKGRSRKCVVITREVARGVGESLAVTVAFSSPPAARTATTGAGD